jgi:2'-hydroxyisoflavone reductase
LQWVDARDLCPWIITLAEHDRTGVFNAAGPVKPVNRQQVLRELVRLGPVPVHIQYATPEVMMQTGISLPLVDPHSGGGADSVHTSGEAARTVGLRYRPLADTARATLDWWRAQTQERRAKPRGWPTAKLERQALQRLQTRWQSVALRCKAPGRDDRFAAGGSIPL